MLGCIRLRVEGKHPYALFFWALVNESGLWGVYVSPHHSFSANVKNQDFIRCVVAPDKKNWSSITLSAKPQLGLQTTDSCALLPVFYGNHAPRASKAPRLVQLTKTPVTLLHPILAPELRGLSSPTQKHQLLYQGAGLHASLASGLGILTRG